MRRSSDLVFPLGLRATRPAGLVLPLVAFGVAAVALFFFSTNMGIHGPCFLIHIAAAAAVCVPVACYLDRRGQTGAPSLAMVMASCAIAGATDGLVTDFALDRYHATIALDNAFSVPWSMLIPLWLAAVAGAVISAGPGLVVLTMVTLHHRQPLSRPGSIAYQSERFRLHRVMAVALAVCAALIAGVPKTDGYRESELSLGLATFDVKAICGTALIAAAVAWTAGLALFNLSLLRWVRRLEQACRDTDLCPAGALPEHPDDPRLVDFGLGLAECVRWTPAASPYHHAMSIAAFFRGDAAASRAPLRRALAIDLAALAVSLLGALAAM